MNDVIVVASGKGGTGKSTVCICLSVALIKQGKKVLLIDCDCGMRGLDIMLDMEQDLLFDASDAVCGNCTFQEAIYQSRNNQNLYLMAAPFDTENELSPSVFKQLVRAVKGSFDFVIIDSPAGIGSGFVTAAAPADSALIVTNAEPTSVRGGVKVRQKLEAMGIEKANPFIVSCGGGVPLREENVEIMKDNGVVIWLSAEAETIAERLSGANDRPLLPGDKDVDSIREMLQIRTPYYQRAADFMVV